MRQTGDASNLVYLVDDSPFDLPGCDAGTVHNVDTGAIVYQGGIAVSPGRGSASVDGIVVMNHLHFGLDDRPGSRDITQPFLYEMRWDGEGGWKTSVLVGQPFARLGAVLLLGDHEHVLAPLTRGSRLNSPDASYYGPPYQLAVFSLAVRAPVTTPAGDAQRYALADPIETLEIGAIPVAIWRSSAEDEIIAVTHDANVHRIRLNPLREAGTMTVPAFRDRHVPIAEMISKASAALSPDGRWLVTTRWDAGGIVLTDLESGVQHTYVDDYDRRRVGAVAFSHAGPTIGMLAVHVRSAIKFYRVDGGELVKIGSRPISPPNYPASDNCRGMAFVDAQCGDLAQPLGWSRDGRRLVVASFSGNAEFAVLDVDPRDGSGPKPRYIEVCRRSPENGGDNEGSVVVSTNGRDYTRPSPTPTDLEPTATPIARSTPSPTVSDPTATTTNLPSATGTETRRPTSTVLTPQPTSSPTETATDVSTVTPLPIANPTKVPDRLFFLPLALVEQCPPRDLFTDVVLVLDASTSMLDRTTDGRRKIDVATEAIRSFVSGLRLWSGQDRVGIVQFNATAELLTPLTEDRTRLELALSRIHVQALSRLELGVERAMGELVARGKAGHQQAMVILSDGKTNPNPGELAVTAARRAQGAGIVVYVVGYGPSLDERVLSAMASGASRYYPAYEPLAIRNILGDLTTHVLCPPSAFWGQR
jgi:hypothetical protein